MASIGIPGISGPWKHARSVYREYPRQFWILASGAFIDRLGSALLFPFFSLYLTRKFNLGMTEVGLVFAVFAITGLASGFVGGALTDRMGRKRILLFGLVMSGLSSLLMGVIHSIALFLLVTVIVGLLADVGYPAQQAMVADLLPEEKRAGGFGILRVVANLAVTFGPMIGGLLAAQSYLFLFLCDAITSVIAAIILFFTLQETRKAVAEGDSVESIAQTFGGYRNVLSDLAFSGFLMASMLMVIAYMQMNTTLGVYLRDVHGVPERAFGYILSLNAAMVVLFQFPITHRISKYRPMNVMVVGTLFYAIGFSMYGFVRTYPLFLLAMAVITIGEMLVSPVGQAIVSRLAPEEMRGRYMATFGFSWVIPSMIGPLLAGLVMDHLDPRWVWYGAGLIAALSALGYYLLEWLVGNARWTAVQERLQIIEKLETGQITAEEAARQLSLIGEGRWARLSPAVAATHSRPQRHLRIQVNDLGTGTMKADLRLPAGLVNTILFTSGRVSANLDHLDSNDLRELISKSAHHDSEQSMQVDGDQQVIVSVEPPKPDPS